MILVKNKRTGEEYYLTEQEVKDMKAKKLFTNFTVLKAVAEMPGTTPPKDILDFMEAKRKQAEIEEKRKEAEKVCPVVNHQEPAPETNKEETPKEEIEVKPKRQYKKKTDGN